VPGWGKEERYQERRRRLHFLFLVSPYSFFKRTTLFKPISLLQEKYNSQSGPIRTLKSTKKLKKSTESPLTKIK